MDTKTALTKAEISRRYRARNLEKCRQRCKDWAVRNKDIVKRNNAAFRARPEYAEWHRNYNREWSKKNPEKVKASELLRTTGLTLEQYKSLLYAQGGYCAVCGISAADQTQKKLLSVDHCHDSNRIRGLLCDTCNRAIGLFGDSIDRLHKAIAYLQREPTNLIFKRTKAPRKPKLSLTTRQPS